MDDVNQILDPATGTATFLVEVIDVIFRTLKAQWKQKRMTDGDQQLGIDQRFQGDIFVAGL